MAMLTLMLIIPVSNLSAEAFLTSDFSVSYYVCPCVSSLSLIRGSYYLKVHHLCAWKCQHTEGISDRDASRASARFSESHPKITGQPARQPPSLSVKPSLAVVVTIRIALPPQPCDVGIYESWLAVGLNVLKHVIDCATTAKLVGPAGCKDTY